MSEREQLKKLAEAATEYPGYFVNDQGDVISTVPWRGKNRRVLTAFPNSHGYPSVKVALSGGKCKKALIHKMVCVAFHGPKPTPEHEVRHLNGVRSDNRAVNLAWGTKSENAIDRQSHGTDKAAANGKAGAYKLRGRCNPYCKRGHDKKGLRSCEECRRISRRERAI